MLPKVAVIYLCYNTRHYLDDVFASVKQLNYPKEKLEIIAVDNDSQDGSPEWFREQEEITFMPSGSNLGFAEGNNLGINHAILDGCKYVFLLNGDAKLDQNAIMEAVKLAESDEKIGAVQSRIMLWKEPNVVNVTGGMVNFLGFGFARDNGRRWEEVEKEVQDGEEIAFASGAATLFRSAVLQKVGLLESFYFMYHEDLELGWRIRLAGYKNVLSTKSIAYHDYEFKRSIKKFYWMERNRILVHFSHLKWSTLLILAPFMLAAEFGLFVFALKGGWLKEKMLVWVNLLSPSVWKHVRTKRQESTFLREVSDREIVRHWTSTIDHQETQSPIVDKLINPALSVTWFILKRLIR
jgi:GT2 family glycosyltransferase